MKRSASSQWLEIICSTLPGTDAAIFMMSDQKRKQLKPMAKWPDQFSQANDFAEIVKYTVKKKEPACFAHAHESEHQAFDLFSVPFIVKSELAGVLVVRLKAMPEHRHKSILSFLKQSLKWLKLANTSQGPDDEFFSRIVALLASCFEQTTYQQGLIGMVSELTTAFECERVAFAEYKNHYNTVTALSNSADFDKQSNLIQALSSAMDEAVEQDNIIVFPGNKSNLINRAHLELARKFGTGSICTIPLVHEQKTFGTISLLRSEDRPFDKQTLMLCEQAFALITPYLVLKNEQEKKLVSKIGVSLKQRLQQLFGFRGLKLKIASLLIATLVIASSVLEGDFRVSADAILEGKVQRVITAPFAGYLLSSSVRAGDTVRKGDIMASLNDSEINLQISKLQGQLQKAKREYREAQSKRDLVKVRVVSEQVNQIKAEIELAQQQLEKIDLVAPFDGVVIEGDVSQTLGAPVERGEALFKVAPLEGYRIILKVEETKISYIEKGQPGILVLPSLSDHDLPLSVEKITVASRAENGSNIFRVEASLSEAAEQLRPGMQGVGKILVGKACFLWIWTHDIITWMRLWFWKWMP